MSEISDIPISRCSTVSRLDRIRTLWCCMLPLGALSKQRCVASSSAGCRAAPGHCPAWSRDEAFSPSVARWFMTQESWVGETKEKRNDLRHEAFWDLTPSVHGRLQYARLNTVCVRTISAYCSLFSSLTFLAVLSAPFYFLSESHRKLWATQMFKTAACWQYDSPKESVSLILSRLFWVT